MLLRLSPCGLSTGRRQHHAVRLQERLSHPSLTHIALQKNVVRCSATATTLMSTAEELMREVEVSVAATNGGGLQQQFRVPVAVMFTASW